MYFSMHVPKGLSTVRKLAQLYGGVATVKSEKGSGSIFTVTLRDATPGATAVSEVAAPALTAVHALPPDDQLR